MTTRPYMPLWVADYLGDTGHLTTVQHGAYMLLIMHYWRRGELPTDERQLAQVVRMTPDEWQQHREVLADFFEDGWKHQRIDIEIARAAEKSEQAVNAGRASGQSRRRKKRTDVKQTFNGRSTDVPTECELPESESYSVSKDTGAKAPPDPKASLFDRGREVLGAKAGGLIAKVLRSYGKEDDLRAIAQARARIEEASTKANPAEWLGRVIAPKSGDFKLMSGMEGVV